MRISYVPDPLVQRYADYMTVEARRWEDNNFPKKYKDQLDLDGALFAGVIPHNWEEIVNKKIKEKDDAYVKSKLE